MDPKQADYHVKLLEAQLLHIMIHDETPLKSALNAYNQDPTIQNHCRVQDEKAKGEFILSLLTAKPASERL